jgi:NAD(P) transhydrogenase subunit alpha
MEGHTIINLIIFVLAIYVGYHVVWTVTPALHTPLMAVTNAVSAIIIVGAMLAADRTGGQAAASGWRWRGQRVRRLLVTQRMLEMFKKKEPKAKQQGSRHEHLHESGDPAVPDRIGVLHPGAEGLSSPATARPVMLSA